MKILKYFLIIILAASLSTLFLDLVMWGLCGMANIEISSWGWIQIYIDTLKCDSCDYGLRFAGYILFCISITFHILIATSIYIFSLSLVD